VRCQLDRQRQPIQPQADTATARALLRSAKPGQTARALNEQHHCVLCQRHVVGLDQRWRHQPRADRRNSRQIQQRQRRTVFLLAIDPL
jgi:hypothetical protein